MPQHIGSLPTTGCPFRLPKAIAGFCPAFQGGNMKRIAYQYLIELGQRRLERLGLQERFCLDID